MQIYFDTRSYYTSHLKEPRGRGGWAFAIGDRNAEPWWAPSCMMYADAKKLAKIEARSRGVSTVFVLP